MLPKASDPKSRPQKKAVVGCRWVVDGVVGAAGSAVAAVSSAGIVGSFSAKRAIGSKPHVRMFDSSPQSIYVKNNGIFDFDFGLNTFDLVPNVEMADFLYNMTLQT